MSLKSSVEKLEASIPFQVITHAEMMEAHYERLAQERAEHLEQFWNNLIHILTTMPREYANLACGDLRAAQDAGRYDPENTTMASHGYNLLTLHAMETAFAAARGCAVNLNMPGALCELWTKQDAATEPGAWGRGNAERCVDCHALHPYTRLPGWSTKTTEAAERYVTACVICGGKLLDQFFEGKI